MLFRSLISNTVHELNKTAQNLGLGELNATAIYKLFEMMAGLGDLNKSAQATATLGGP